MGGARRFDTPSRIVAALVLVLAACTNEGADIALTGATPSTAAPTAVVPPGPVVLPDDGNFNLSFDVTCQPTPCRDLDGRHEVIYRSGVAIYASPTEPNDTATPPNLVDWLPTLEELVSNAVGGAFDTTTNLPLVAERGDIEFSDFAVLADVAMRIPELDAAIAAWEASEIENYRLELTRGCVCSITGRISVDVIGSDVTLVDKPTDEPDAAVLDLIPTSVDELHEWIRTMIAREPDILDVEYDARGVPLRVHSRDVGVINGGGGLSSISVSPLP